MSDTVDVNIRLDDHPADYSSGIVTDPLARTAYIIVTDKPIRLEMQSRDPGVLWDLGHALIDLADDLEVALRPYVGDEDDERGGDVVSAVGRLTSWEHDREPDDSLPPDLMPYNDTHKTCDAVWADWYCTRRAGHTGRHAAGTGKHIVAVWPEPEWSLPLHRTEAGYPRCATCDGGGCPDCTGAAS